MRTVALIGPEISMFEEFGLFGLFETLLDPTRSNFETPDMFSCLEVLFLSSVGSKMGV